MAGLGHLGIGFATKAWAPKIHLVVLLVASEFIDLLWALFYLTGIDRGEQSLWTHSLFMSTVWSVMAGLLALAIYKNLRSGVLIALVVFSHWVIDFITHPMGALFGGKPLPPDLPLFFSGSPKVGLGLYNHSFALAIATDLGMLLLGIAVYVWQRRKQHSQSQMQFKK